MTRRNRLVLVGGGHSHVEVLRQFAMMPLEAASVTLVARDLLAPYSGMLPGFIAGHYAYHECHIDLRPLARAAGARLCHAEVQGLDLTKKLLFYADRPAIPFDVLSLNIGSRPTMDEVPGAQEYALPAKPVDRFIQAWQALLDDLEARPRGHRFVVVGAGAGGVELALAMQHRLAGLNIGASIEFTLLSATDNILPTHNPRVRERLKQTLANHGVSVRTRESATGVTENEVVCASGLRIPYNTLIWTTHAAPMPWLRESGLAVDERGFVSVNAQLQSVSHPFVFAAGDTATLNQSPTPKSGVFAVREGIYLGYNLRAQVEDRELVAYMPQRRYLSLISTGDKKAIASRGNWSAGGGWVWRWKDHIDRSWIAKYKIPTPVTPPSADMAPMNAAESDDMRCAGCGAKLGPEALARSLARLEHTPRHDVLVGLDTPEDAAVVEPTPGMLAVHSVDFFPALVEDAYLAGKIAAVHCLGDIYVMGAAPHTALAMVTLPATAPDTQEDQLVDALAGALSVFTPEHVALVGGHTLQGDRLEIGFAVNGFIARENLPHVSRSQSGDALVLTKPLGIGAIFAADMRGRAQTDWLDEGMAVMLQSNAAAAQIIFSHGAISCTDVTGFGLAGHLLRLLKHDDLAAKINLADVPVLAGALAATRAGFKSSLFPQNIASEENINATPVQRGHEAYPLLFDPQTAGGLLAAIPAAQTKTCLAALHEAGYIHATTIGILRESSPNATRISLA